MKTLLGFLGAAALLTAAPALAAPVTYPDGTIATAMTKCGQGDLCATIALPGGDVISVYSLGGPQCQPYTLHIVRSHGDAKVLAYEQKLGGGGLTDDGICGKYINTWLTFDEGTVRMGMFQNKDGTLFAQFDPPKP